MLQIGDFGTIDKKTGELIVEGNIFTHPQIKQIAKDFAGQPLVILSISWDEDEQRWKKFIAKNQMTWPQYRDTGHRIGNLFEVKALPGYFTIDSDGVLTAELLGGGFDIESRLKALVDKAKIASPKPVN